MQITRLAILLFDVLSGAPTIQMSNLIKLQLRNLKIALQTESDIETIPNGEVRRHSMITSLLVSLACLSVFHVRRSYAELVRVRQLSLQDIHL